MQAGFQTPPSIDVSLIVGFTIEKRETRNEVEWFLQTLKSNTKKVFLQIYGKALEISNPLHQTERKSIKNDRLDLFSEQLKLM